MTSPTSTVSIPGATSRLLPFYQHLRGALTAAFLLLWTTTFVAPVSADHGPEHTNPGIAIGVNGSLRASPGLIVDSGIVTYTYTGEGYPSWWRLQGFHSLFYIAPYEIGFRPVEWGTVSFTPLPGGGCGAEKTCRLEVRVTRSRGEQAFGKFFPNCRAQYYLGPWPETDPGGSSAQSKIALYVEGTGKDYNIQLVNPLTISASGALPACPQPDPEPVAVADSYFCEGDQGVSWEAIPIPEIPGGYEFTAASGEYCDNLISDGIYGDIDLDSEEGYFEAFEMCLSDISADFSYGDGNTEYADLDDNAVTKVYDRPGDYVVNLTVAGPDGNIPVSCPIKVPAPPLYSRLVFKDVPELIKGNGDRRFEVKLGDPIDLELTVSSGWGAGPLSNVQFSAPTGVEYPADLVNLLGDTPPAITDSVMPLQDDFYNQLWRFKGTQEGVAQFRAPVSGLDANGDPAPSSFSERQVVIGEAGLKAVITLTPGHIEVQEEDINGDPIPIEFQADLSICNTSDNAITEVILREFRAHPAVGQAFFVTRLTGPEIDNISGLPVGTLAAGQCQQFTATYRADDDAEVEVDALVTGLSPENTTLRSIAEELLSIGPKYLLEVKTEILRPFPDEPLLPAGDTIRIQGTVKNLSNSHRIQIGPMFAELAGNTGVQSLSWDTVGTDPGDFIVPKEPVFLEEGESRDFTLRITTLASDPRHDGKAQGNGGTRAHVKFTPWGIATIRGEEGSTLVTPDRIKSTVEDLELQIPIDDSVAIPQWDPLAIGGGIMIGAVQAAYDMAAGLVLGVVELVKLPYTVIGGAAEYQSRVWNSFTEEEKLEFANDTALTAAYVLLRNYDLATQDFDTLKEAVNQQVYQSMTDMANEWELGNHADVIRVYTRYGGQAVGEIAMEYGMAKLAKSAKAAPALKRAQDEKNARMATLLSRAEVDGLVSADRVEDILFTVENGTEADLATLRNSMGWTPEEVSEFRAIANEFNILMTSRSRLVEAIKWIKKYGAKLKPEGLKAKSVSALDELLGYPRIYNGESPVGALIFKKPDALVYMEQFGGTLGEGILRHLDSVGIKPVDDVYQEAVDRILLRVEEWQKYEKKYKDLSKKGWLETTFTNKFNGISDEVWLDVTGKLDPKLRRQGTSKFERFRLRPLKPKSDPFETYMMEMFDIKSGKWVPITGDIDNIAFTRLDGTALDEVTHAQVTLRVSQSPVLGARHGESATAKKGIGGIEFILKQFKPGEAAVQIAPGDGPARFVRLNERKSFWEDPRHYRLHWDGGHAQVTETPLPSGVKPPVNLPNNLPPKASLPEGKPAALPAPLASGEPNVGRCKVSFDTGENVPAVIMGGDGTLKEVTANGSTKPSSLHETCFGEGTGTVEIKISPSTVLKKGVKAANKIIDIYTDDSVAKMGGSDGLQVGQSVVIGAGTTGAELGAISGFGSIILENGLKYDHTEGEVVVVLNNPIPMDSDLDGVPDYVDAFPNDPSESVDTDGDGVGNNTDQDDDGDGFSDAEELATNADPLDANDTPADHAPAAPLISNVLADTSQPLSRFSVVASAFDDPDTSDNIDALELLITGLLDNGLEGPIFHRQVPSIDPLVLSPALLDPGANYEMALRHRDSTGQWSPWSEFFAFTAVSPDPADTDASGIADSAEGHPQPNDGSRILGNAVDGKPLAIKTSAGSLSRMSTLGVEGLPFATDASFPVGLAGFRINNLEPGASVDVTFTLHGALAGERGYLQYDSAHPFDELVDLGAYSSFNGKTVTVTYTDGSFGDLDGVANGRIVDPGGPVGELLLDPADTTPPDILLPLDMEVSGDSAAGAVVEYDVSAMDDTDPAPLLNCIPASGSVFPVGHNFVTCTATDNSNNRAQKTFTISVIYGGEPALDLTITGYELVSARRSGRTTYDYILRLNYSNTGGTGSNVEIEVSSLNPATKIIDGSVLLDVVEANTNGTSVDTITVRQNRRYRFNPGSLDSRVIVPTELAAP